MVDSEKLSLCCSDVGRYLLLGVGEGEGDVERDMDERWMTNNKSKQWRTKKMEMTAKEIKGGV